MLWTAALVLVCAPYGFFLFASETVEHSMISYSVGACPGFQLRTVALMHISPLFLLPAPLVIAIGFAARRPTRPSGTERQRDPRSNGSQSAA